MVLSRSVIEISVELGERRYPVAIGHGLARMLPDLLSSLRGRRIVVVNGTRGDLDFASRLPEARGAFLDTPGFLRLWEGPARVFLVTQRAPERSVLAAAPPDSVHLLGRFGSRWLYSNQGSA